MPHLNTRTKPLPDLFHASQMAFRSDTMLSLLVHAASAQPAAVEVVPSAVLPALDAAPLLAVCRSATIPLAIG